MRFGEEYFASKNHMELFEGQYGLKLPIYFIRMKIDLKLQAFYCNLLYIL